MPNIPLIADNTSVSTPLPNPIATPDMMGAGIGAGIGQIGAALSDVGQNMRLEMKKKENELRTERVTAAVAQADYSKRFADQATAAPPGAKGFTDQVGKDYDRWVEDMTKDVADPEDRRQIKMQLQARRLQYTSGATSFEVGSAKTEATRQSNLALDALTNKVRSSPMEYEQALADGMKVIDTSSAVPADMREAAKVAFRQQLAKRRFEALAGAATTVEEIDGLVKEMEKGSVLPPPADAIHSPGRKVDWKSEMSTADYDRTLDALKSARRSIGTAQDTEARNAIATLKERSNADELIPPDELARVEGIVKKSKNALLFGEYADLRIKQDVLRANKGMAVPQQRAEIEARKGAASATGLIPQELAAHMEEASRFTGGRVSTGFLIGTAIKEYGKQLEEGRKTGKYDWGVVNTDGTTDATGVYQFLGKTWLGLMRGTDGKGGLAKQLGIADDVIGNDAKLLALRADPRINTIAAAVYADQNARAVEKELGRPLSDGEHYMLHFLGPQGGKTLITVNASDPGADAVALFPKAAEANKTVFYRADGSPRTVAEVHRWISTTFSGNKDRVGYVDTAARQAVLDATVKAMKDDPIAWAQQSGRFVVRDLGESLDSWRARGETARQLADYHQMAITDIKPFSKVELEGIQKQIAEGTAEDTMKIMARVAAMGGDVAKAGFAQLGETNPALAQAGRIAYDEGDIKTATDVVRGQRMLAEDKMLRDNIGYSPRDFSDKLMKYLGPSFAAAPPGMRQGIHDAVMAHYVATYTSKNGSRNGSTGEAALKRSMDAVTGGRVAPVNGFNTILPKGVTAAAFDGAVDAWSDVDYVRLSADGRPPVYADGSAVMASTIATSGQFTMVGEKDGVSFYQVVIKEGSLITMDPATKAVRPYIMQVTRAEIAATLADAAKPKAPPRGAPAPPAGTTPPPPPPGSAAPSATPGTIMDEIRKATGGIVDNTLQPPGQ